VGELGKKLEGQERVMREMKKQIASYKSELQGIKKMEAYLNLENYQKLINEFNTLYDHYKGLKQINKKLKLELKQSNQRERTFLKLLKKTKEYGE
jgi:thiamine kinase-like enzyme